MTKMDKEYIEKEYEQAIKEYNAQRCTIIKIL